VLDGKGRVLRDTRIVIEGSKIVAIDPKAGPVDYDLRGLVMKGGVVYKNVARSDTLILDDMETRKDLRRPG
jgi:hypothetical protein